MDYLAVLLLALVIGKTQINSYCGGISRVLHTSVVSFPLRNPHHVPITISRACVITGNANNSPTTISVFAVGERYKMQIAGSATNVLCNG